MIRPILLAVPFLMSFGGIMTDRPEIPAGLIEAFHTTPLTESDKRAADAGMIPDGVWATYVSGLKTQGPPVRISDGHWEVVLDDGTKWACFGDCRMIPGRTTWP